jgi:hypothetical protein
MNMTDTHRLCLEILQNFPTKWAFLIDVKPEVDAFVDGEACDKTMLMVDMRP